VRIVVCRSAPLIAQRSGEEREQSRYDSLRNVVIVRAVVFLKRVSNPGRIKRLSEDAIPFQQAGIRSAAVKLKCPQAAQVAPL
jgi:hypothetical protein